MNVKTYEALLGQWFSMYGQWSRSILVTQELGGNIKTKKQNKTKQKTTKIQGPLIPSETLEVVPSNLCDGKLWSQV